MKDNIVSKENSNHCVSGGFIFDQMDRFAHDKIKKRYRIKKGFLFTRNSDVMFLKQICDWNEMKLKIDYGSKKPYYFVLVSVKDKRRGRLFAKAFFTFEKKDHAYCDTKGE